MITSEKHGGSKATQVEQNDIFINRGRWMKKRQAYLSGLLTDPDYLAAPARPDEAVLEAQVQSYRHGDCSVRDAIITSHLHVVAAAAGDHSHRQNVDEILGEALLALVDAVDRAAEALVDNAITPYIMAVVRDRIKNIIASDRAVHMPARTFRYKAAKGELDHEEDIATRGVVSLTALVSEDTRDLEEDQASPSVRSGLHIIPIARPEEPSVEFREVLNLAIHNETERRVIDLRSEGYGYGDMEEILGLKKSTIGYHVHQVESRFLSLYA